MANIFHYPHNNPNLFSHNSTSTMETEHEGISTIKNYVLFDTIGQGGYGKVRLGIDKNTHTEYAIKIVNKDDLRRKREILRDEKGRVRYKTALDNLKEEIAIMEQLDHPNIIKLIETIEDEDSSFAYLVMEYLQGGQLLEWDEANKEFYSSKYDGYLSEDALRAIFQGVIEVHQHGIIHRDLKPQNILQDHLGRPKIVDFGVARKLADPNRDSMTNTEGTHYFMAPESLVENTSMGYSGKAADIWAMGVTFYAFTFHRLPFYHENLLDLFTQIESQQLEFPEDRIVSDELKSLLENLLEKDPKKRIDIEGLKKNEWMNQTSKSPSKMSDITNRRIMQVKSKLKKSLTLEEQTIILSMDHSMSSEVAIEDN